MSCLKEPIVVSNIKPGYVNVFLPLLWYSFRESWLKAIVLFIHDLYFSGFLNLHTWMVSTSYQQTTHSLPSQLTIHTNIIFKAARNTLQYKCSIIITSSSHHQNSNKYIQEFSFLCSSLQYLIIK